MSVFLVTEHRRCGWTEYDFAIGRGPSYPMARWSMPRKRAWSVVVR